MVLVHSQGLISKNASNLPSPSIYGNIGRNAREPRKNGIKGDAGAIRQLPGTLSWEAVRPVPGDIQTELSETLRVGLAGPNTQALLREGDPVELGTPQQN